MRWLRQYLLGCTKGRQYEQIGGVARDGPSDPAFADVLLSVLAKRVHDNIVNYYNTEFTLVISEFPLIPIALSIFYSIID